MTRPRNGAMNLVLFFNPVGRLTHSWRRTGSKVEDLMSLDLAADIARRAEDARFDAVFLSDKLSFDEDVANPPLNPYEPLTTLGALAATTSHLGLIATISTTFTEPYNTARMLTQLDHLSSGRIGWNVVTSHSGDENFIVDLPPKAERYAQADEFLSVCYQLWDAWADDAIGLDRANGQWADPTKIAHPHFVGKHYSVRDALAMPPSPQRRPVIVQAGQSPEGMAFAARHAEVVFTSQSEAARAAEFHQSLLTKVAERGRRTPSVAVLPGLIPIVAESQAEAESIRDELADLVRVDVGLEDISHQLAGVDLTGLDLDEPIPADHLLTPEEAAQQKLFTASRYTNLYSVITHERPTLRELIRTRAKSNSHHMLCGTAGQVADVMQDWYDSERCEGFTITPPFMPEGLERVCELLIPELQQRGLARTEYSTNTLRGTLADTGR